MRHMDAGRLVVVDVVVAAAAAVAAAVGCSETDALPKLKAQALASVYSVRMTSRSRLQDAAK